MDRKLVRFCIVFMVSFAVILHTGEGLAYLPRFPERHPVTATRTEFSLNPEVRDSPALVQTIADQPLADRARELSERGQFAEAIALLQQEVANSVARGDKLGEAIALQNLSLVYQKTGEGDKAKAAIAGSLQLLQKLDKNEETLRILALTIESQGQLQLSVFGQDREALDSWTQAATLYQQIGDVTGALRSQIARAGALQFLGEYRQAIATLTEANTTLNEQPDTPLKAKGLQSLGDALRAIGDLERSQETLQQSLAIAGKFSDRESQAAILLSLGNTARIGEHPESALDLYQRAVSESPSLDYTIPAQLNQLSLLVEREKWEEARELVPQIQSNLSKLPPSRTSVYDKINLARSLMKLIQKSASARSIETKIGGDLTEDITHAAGILATAVREARALKDTRSEAYAMGNLGRLYEQNQQWNEAQKLTEEALVLAQAIEAPDIAYEWEWQLGRVNQAQGNREKAIAAYTQAVTTLQSLRRELVSMSSDVQFSFRESVEPVYRELVGLLLQPGADVKQSDLMQARQTIELLQLAELDNFFRDACLNNQPAPIDRIDPKAAVLYTIILSDRLEVISALPGQPLNHYSTPLSQETVDAKLKTVRETLTIPRFRLSVENFLRPSREVYDWLIRPIESDLAASEVTTLVFVLDGGLRSIPIAALYDGEKYLIEKYSVAIAPGLQLVDDRPLTRDKLKILAAGLSEGRQGFSPLPGVEFELQRISTEVSTQKLLNQSFTEPNLTATLNSFPYAIVHLATHGEFSSRAEDTFILTWDDRINAKQFDRLLRRETQKARSIELLVLSACKTAAGDKRAALGLAGIAVRAGARSTLASLWYVSDEATSLLMTRFYEELASPNRPTKAEALRQAQQEVLRNPEFFNPYFWSAFVLVGNWL